MDRYHKIQTIFKRDPATNHKTLLMGEYSWPEFEYLKDNEWVYTEKVDGTSIRVVYEVEESGDSHLRFGGKTDNAQIPVPLYDALQDMFGPLAKAGILSEVFENTSVCLYGEGYGAKIQKGGGNYRPDQSFVLFDIKIGDWWLGRDAIDEIAPKLGLSVVPVIGTGPCTTWWSSARTASSPSGVTSRLKVL